MYRKQIIFISSSSPYFQKIFMDNPCKHPIIVLKDIRGWEVQCIVDFMYKGETSVPESQLTGLIKAAESLKVRGLTSSDQQLPQGLTLETSNAASGPAGASSSGSGGSNSSGNPLQNGYGGHHGRSSSSRAYSPGPASGSGGSGGTGGSSGSSGGHPYENGGAKLARSHSSQSSPMSLTNHGAEERQRSPGPPGSSTGSAPRRKQARPRRRSGDSVGNSSLDLSKADSPPSSIHGGFRKSPPSSEHHPHHASHMDVDAAPENLSLKRPSSSPAINLVRINLR